MHLGDTRSGLLGEHSPFVSTERAMPGSFKVHQDFVQFTNPFWIQKKTVLQTWLRQKPASW